MAKQRYRQTDLKLFSTLRQNSRLSLTEMSRKTNIPVSTIYERLRSYYGDIIKRYTVLLDFNKLGYGIRVSIFLKVANNNREKLLRYLEQQQQINNAYRISHGFDILCDAIFTDIGSAEEFTRDLEQKFKLSKIQMFYILEEIKREGFFAESCAC